jgi:uncharacterized NAD(P)/FAD-binding protein YdhS
MVGIGQRTIAIVGAGYSGAVVAINLLRDCAHPTRIVLIDRSGTVGRGVAYARRDFPYMLNVPASAMAASSSAPLEFLEYARAQVPTVRGEDFMSRELYGDYIESLVKSATVAAHPHITLEICQGDVVDVTDGTPMRLQFADGSTLDADEAVLALGNPSPADPTTDGSLTGLPGLRPDPWTPVSGADPRQPLLVIGSGLTMADIVCDSIARHPERQIYVLSRHGFIPPEQTNFNRTPAALSAHPLIPTPSLRHLVSASRTLAYEIERLGGDWRTAIATIRNEAPRLWHALPDAERRRFLRHVRSYWDVFRHRLPGAVRARIAALHALGQLKLLAGRIRSVGIDDDSLVAEWVPRRQTLVQQLRIGEIANCTGPDYDVRRSKDPLWRNLVARGAAVADALGLGIHTGAYGALRDTAGHTHRHLYYVGPMLRADHWEVTAAAELRGHAEALARQLAVQDRTSR